MEDRHHGDDGGLARVVAQRDHLRWQPEQRPADLASLDGFLGLAGPLGPAALIDLEMKKPLAEVGVLQHREVVIQTGAEPHDVGRIPEIPGRPPFLVQRSTAATNKVGPNHLHCEAGRDGAEDSSGGDRELPIVGIEITPVVTMDKRTPTDFAKWPWLFLYNPAPPASPFIPPLLLEAFRVCALAQRPRDPSNRASNGIPLLNPGEEIVAEERRDGVESGEALAEMGEKGHARHDIWSEIQKVEAVGVHDVVEEIRGRGQRPQEK